MSQKLPKKKDVTVALLQSSFSVFVHLDPRHERVSVPPQFRRQAHLILEIGLNMPVPIRDLEVDDDGITCTLSFSRTPHWCRMPWDAVFAIVGQDQRGMVWPEDVPPDSQFKFTQAPAEAAAPKPKAIRAVPDMPDEAADAPAEAAPAATSVEADREAVADADPKAEPDAPAAEESTDEPSSSEADGPKAKVRKLPPYLRVVK